MSSYAGSFLVASPNLHAPNFRHSVVLLLQHRAEGAFGLIVNRPSARKGHRYPVFTGGPCKAQGLLMLHGHAEWLTPNPPAREIVPGIYVGDIACVKRVSDEPIEDHFRFRMFSGYACWSKDQLEREIDMGIWLLVPATAELLFDTPVEDLWEDLILPGVPRFSIN
jgi:putative transcriptional regulator